MPPRAPQLEWLLAREGLWAYIRRAEPARRPGLLMNYVELTIAGGVPSISHVYDEGPVQIFRVHAAGSGEPPELDAEAGDLPCEILAMVRREQEPPCRSN